MKFSCYYCFSCVNCSVNKRCYLLNPRDYLLQYVCMPLQSSYTFKYMQTHSHEYIYIYIYIYIYMYVRINSRDLNSRNALLEFRPGRCLTQCSENFLGLPPIQISQMYFKSGYERFRTHPFNLIVCYHQIIGRHIS